jgi:3'-phosphoadenosine 5'-phosphosulfate sulfotransferase (PAPS reductase)/FAD synthetase
MTKAVQSIELIRRTANAARRPAAMLSFGKDSMVLADLIRKALGGAYSLNGEHFPTVHGFPVPVIYHRAPWFPIKHEFAERTARAWAMEVHDFPPVAAGVKTNDKLIELVARYAFGNSFMDVPKNVCDHSHYPAQRDYICALNDWLQRPKTAVMPYPWDLVFHGHKSADVDPFEGNVRLKTDEAEVGKVRLVFPLKDWTDEDVWQHLEENHIALQETRYHAAHRKESTDYWYNNDYVHACTACVDPREKRPEVFCPKLRRNVPNVSAKVLKLRTLPEYAEVHHG